MTSLRADWPRFGALLVTRVCPGASLRAEATQHRAQVLPLVLPFLLPACMLGLVRLKGFHRSPRFGLRSHVRGGVVALLIPELS